MVTWVSRMKWQQKNGTGLTCGVPCTHDDPPVVGISLNGADNLCQLVHSLPTVVCVHVHIFCTKVTPLEAIHWTKITWRRDDSLITCKTTPTQHTPYCTPSPLPSHHSPSSLCCNPLESRKSREPLASQMCTFFSLNFWAFVHPEINHRSSSATPRQNTRFVVNSGNWSRKLNLVWRITKTLLPHKLCCNSNLSSR